MAEEVQRSDAPPPPGEAVHLPGPSYLPAIAAAGIAIALVGLVIGWWLFGGGLAIATFAVARWIREIRAEISDLPLEHTR